MSSKPYSDLQRFNMSHSLGLRLTHWKYLKQPVTTCRHDSVSGKNCELINAPSKYIN
jgi:hypothetical protein